MSNLPLKRDARTASFTSWTPLRGRLLDLRWVPTISEMWSS